MKGAMPFDQIAFSSMQKLGERSLNRGKYFEAE
jgi:hypothetical protein